MSMNMQSIATMPLANTLLVAANKFASSPEAIKGTVTNDPTAGMTPDQITNYMSNVGGGMCGNDQLGTAIGLGLNISLIVFGFFTVSYVILGGLSFKYSKDVEEIIKNSIGSVAKPKSDDGLSSRRPGTPQPIGNFGAIQDDRDAPSGPGGPSKNREERRLQRKIQDKRDGR